MHSRPPDAVLNSNLLQLESSFNTVLAKIRCLLQKRNSQLDKDIFVDWAMKLCNRSKFYIDREPIKTLERRNHLAEEMLLVLERQAGEETGERGKNVDVPLNETLASKKRLTTLKSHSTDPLAKQTKSFYNDKTQELSRYSLDQELLAIMLKDPEQDCPIPLECNAVSDKDPRNKINQALINSAPTLGKDVADLVSSDHEARKIGRSIEEYHKKGVPVEELAKESTARFHVPLCSSASVLSNMPTQLLLNSHDSSVIAEISRIAMEMSDGMAEPRLRRHEEKKTVNDLYGYARGTWSMPTKSEQNGRRKGREVRGKEKLSDSNKNDARYSSGAVSPRAVNCSPDLPGGTRDNSQLTGAETYRVGSPRRPGNGDEEVWKSIGGKDWKRNGEKDTSMEIGNGCPQIIPYDLDKFQSSVIEECKSVSRWHRWEEIAKRGTQKNKDDSLLYQICNYPSEYHVYHMDDDVKRLYKGKIASIQNKCFGSKYRMRWKQPSSYIAPVQILYDCLNDTSSRKDSRKTKLQDFKKRVKRMPSSEGTQTILNSADNTPRSRKACRKKLRKSSNAVLRRASHRNADLRGVQTTDHKWSAPFLSSKIDVSGCPNTSFNFEETICASPLKCRDRPSSAVLTRMQQECVGGGHGQDEGPHLEQRDGETSPRTSRAPSDVCELRPNREQVGPMTPRVEKTVEGGMEGPTEVLPTPSLTELVFKNSKSVNYSVNSLVKEMQSKEEQVMCQGEPKCVVDDAGAYSEIPTLELDVEVTDPKYNELNSDAPSTPEATPKVKESLRMTCESRGSRQLGSASNNDQHVTSLSCSNSVLGIYLEEVNDPQGLTSEREDDIVYHKTESSSQTNQAPPRNFPVSCRMTSEQATATGGHLKSFVPNIHNRSWMYPVNPCVPNSHYWCNYSDAGPGYPYMVPPLNESINTVNFIPCCFPKPLGTNNSSDNPYTKPGVEQDSGPSQKPPVNPYVDYCPHNPTPLRGGENISIMVTGNNDCGPHDKYPLNLINSPKTAVPEGVALTEKYILQSECPEGLLNRSDKQCWSYPSLPVNEHPPVTATLQNIIDTGKPDVKSCGKSVVLFDTSKYLSILKANSERNEIMHIYCNEIPPSPGNESNNLKEIESTDVHAPVDEETSETTKAAASDPQDETQQESHEVDRRRAVSNAFKTEQKKTSKKAELEDSDETFFSSNVRKGDSHRSTRSQVNSSNNKPRSKSTGKNIDSERCRHSLPTPTIEVDLQGGERLKSANTKCEKQTRQERKSDERYLKSILKPATGHDKKRQECYSPTVKEEHLPAFIVANGCQFSDVMRLCSNDKATRPNIKFRNDNMMNDPTAVNKDTHAIQGEIEILNKLSKKTRKQKERGKKKRSS